MATVSNGLLFSKAVGVHSGVYATCVRSFDGDIPPPEQRAVPLPFERARIPALSLLLLLLATIDREEVRYPQLS